MSPIRTNSPFAPIHQGNVRGPSRYSGSTKISSLYNRIACFFCKIICASWRNFYRDLGIEKQSYLCPNRRTPVLRRTKNAIRPNKAMTRMKYVLRLFPKCTPQTVQSGSFGP